MPAHTLLIVDVIPFRLQQRSQVPVCYDVAGRGVTDDAALQQANLQVEVNRQTRLVTRPDRKAARIAGPDHSWPATWRPAPCAHCAPRREADHCWPPAS